MSLTLGATLLEGRQCQFLVWAPHAESVELRILDPRDSFSAATAVHSADHGGERLVRLEVRNRGYHGGIVEGVEPGTRYLYCLDRKKDRPDPASLFQPAGVHGPSQVVDPRAFRWSDAEWRGLRLDDYIVYEIHVGTFTPEGSFDAVLAHLEDLRKLGVTALELMPVAQFPGDRNWGYDGAYPFAVQNSYGGPEGLKKLVNACHEWGLAVVLDVVYNHLGPEGNYLNDFGPYFTSQYQSLWGQALNFDGPESDEVVRFFIENALYWLRDFHIDALRLDAIHGIVDRNGQPFLQLLARSVHEFARQARREIYLIAESDFNDVRYIQPAESGGCGLDAQWSDDFHHALHTLLTGEQTGYYLDFGKLEHLEKAFAEGFVYSGQYSAYRRRRHGNSSRHVPGRQFVVFSQNHDQVGNRLLGDRMSTLVSFEALKLAAGMVILSPYIPLLFMGEEWGERAPFQYFTSHSDAALVDAVRRGRREEFAAFGWQAEPPDPQDEATFLRSKLDHSRRNTGWHQIMEGFYQELIKLRRTLPGLARPDKQQLEVRGLDEEKVFLLRRWNTAGEALIVANFGEEGKSVLVAVPEGNWCKVLDSADQRWRGAGSLVPSRFESSGTVQVSLCPKSFCVFERGMV
ncbi:MAG: malto-oligosyltrehalose trehalohydrolase [Terriglobia bacterium]|jgi:maltooligosyltrehalose trehalohydrolase